jgi:tetratricopeptide (TPR) repeat protein
VRLTSALLGAATLALLNLANLAAAGYGGFASRHLDRPQSPATQEAARLAALWAPWSASRTALLGWVYIENGESSEAGQAYLRALRLAPGDPMLWAEYALALARMGRFDSNLTVATRRALSLAPNSPAVRASIADLGISYWKRGVPEQQEVWLEAMRGERRAGRGGLLATVVGRGQVATFCSGPAIRLDEAEWCDGISTAIERGCYELKPTEPISCK